MENIITSSNIYKCFNKGSNSFFALNGVGMDVPKGRLTILKGRSGSGKTTLMNILSTLDEPSEERPEGISAENTKTEISLSGKEYSKMSINEKEILRCNDIGFIFQAVALIPIMNGYENVDFSLRLSEYGIKGHRGYDNSIKDVQRIRDKRIREVINLVGLKDRMLHLASQMSGGEQQRIAIARAVASKPAVIFADEPTGALDTDSGLKVMKLFQELINAEGITIVMTTHDPGLMELGDVVYEMEDGELVDRRDNN